MRIRPWTKLALPLALLGTSAINVLCSRGLADDATATLVPTPTPVAVSPALPLGSDAPEGLSFEAFETLGDTWAEWVEKTADMMISLGEAESAQAQKTIVADLRGRVATMKVALADEQYKPIHPQLGALSRRLSRRLDFYELLLNGITGEVSSKQAEVTKRNLEQLAAAVKVLEDDLINVPKGADWAPYIGLESLRMIASSDDVVLEGAQFLEDVHRRIVEPAGLTDEQVTFLKRPSFQSVAKNIKAILESSRQTSPEGKELLAETAGKLLEHMEAFEATGNDEAGRQFLMSYYELRSLLPDGGQQLNTKIREHFFGFNLHVTIGEDLMKKVVDDTRTEQSGINERIDEAHVRGCQWTNTKLTVDVKPSDRAAVFELTLDGSVQSNTEGSVSKATIYSTGWANFRAIKEVSFDGKKLTTCPTRVGVNATNQTNDAETCMDGVPLLSGAARDFAINAAEKKRPETEAYTRNKIAQEVRKRFDSETDEKFGANDIDAKLYGPLRKYGLEPDIVSASSTENLLMFRTRTRDRDELAGSQPTHAAAPVDGVLLQIHETLLNNSIDKLGIAGETLSAEELNQKLESQFSDMLGREVKLGKEDAAESSPSKFVFEKADPVRFSIDDGAVTLTLRAGLDQVEGEDIPAQVISIPLKVSIVDGQIVMERGTIRVTPVERPNNVGEQITRAKIIQSKVGERMPDRQTKDGELKLKQQGKEILVHVESLTAEDGWLTVTAR
ncbi:MAG: hypothetical protein R3C01_01935 [Planctomycetaceae bacterium]